MLWKGINWQMRVCRAVKGYAETAKNIPDGEPSGMKNYCFMYSFCTAGMSSPPMELPIVMTTRERRVSTGRSK